MAVIAAVGNALGEPRGARPRGVHGVDLFGGRERGFDQTGRVAHVGALQCHGNHRARVEIEGVFGLVREMRAAVRHLRDLRVGIERVLPVLVRRAFLPTAIEPRQRLTRGRLEAGRLREPGQEFLVRLARVPADEAAHGGIRFQRGRVERHRPPLQQFGGHHPLLHPREARSMRFHVDQAAGAREGGMIRRRGVEPEADEAPHGQRIRGAPCDAALGVQAFGIADEQQPEVAPRRQTRPAHHGRVERLTLLLGEPVEAGLVKDRVQPDVERMARRGRQISRRYPHRGVLARAFAHRHDPHCTITPGSLTRDTSVTFTTDC